MLRVRRMMRRFLRLFRRHWRPEVLPGAQTQVQGPFRRGSSWQDTETNVAIPLRRVQ